MPDSLVLRKIKYAQEKKAEICVELGLTGNPTWDQIIQQISTTPDNITKRAVSKNARIKWNSMESFPTTNNSPIDCICYAGDRTFFIGNSYYYEYAGGWSKKNWNNLAPSKSKGAVRTWNDASGTLHYGTTSVYNPTTDNWEEISGIIGGSFLSNAFPRCFWKDYDGKVHYDYSLSFHKVYDDDTKTWSDVTWNISDFNGDDIWTDGTTIYYSNGASQYYLDSTTNTWQTKTWDSNSAISSFSGKNVCYLPNVKVISSDKTTTPYLATNGNFYKFDTTLGYWTPFKFNNALTSSSSNPYFWYWKEANHVMLYFGVGSNISGLREWTPISNTWEAIIESLDETFEFLMEN